MGVVVSSSHIVSAAPSSSRGGLLTLFPCSSTGSPQGHSLLRSFTCSSIGSLPWGTVLQEQAAPAWVPRRVTSPARKPASAWAPLSTGLQVLAGACSSMGSPQGHSLLRASPCSVMGSSKGCRWRSTPLWTSMGCRGTACLSMVVFTGCRGKISTPASGAPPPPSFFTDLSVCRVVSLT